MGAFVGIILAAIIGAVLAGVAAVTVVQLGSSSRAVQPIKAELIVYGNR